MIDTLNYCKGVNKRKFEEVAQALQGLELRNEEFKGKFLGEGGASDLHKHWVKHIRRTIPAFGDIRGKIIEEIRIEEGEYQKAKDETSKWMSQLHGDVFGELAYIDKTTFDYLKLIPNPRRIRIKFGNIRDESDCITEARSLTSSGIDFQMCLVQIDTGRRTRPGIHDRWIAGDIYEVDFGTDLKNNSLGNSAHRIHVYKKNPTSDRIAGFDATWMRPQNARGGRRKIVESFYP